MTTLERFGIDALRARIAALMGADVLFAPALPVALLSLATAAASSSTRAATATTARCSSTQI